MRVASSEIGTTSIEGNTEVNSVAFAPNGRELAFGCGKQVLIYDLASRRQRPFAATDDEVFAVKYSPDGAWIVMGDQRGNVTMGELASGRLLPKVRAHPPHVYYAVSVEFAKDGRTIYSSGFDGEIHF